MFANLEKNLPQIKLNIAPYEFICFVEMGIKKGEAYHSNHEIY